MTSILVTGGAGYIGSHVCKALAARGFQPIAFDRVSHGGESATKWGPLEIGDVGDTVRVRGVLDKYQPQAVMHLAASTHVFGPVQDPLLYYRNNVGGTQSFLEALTGFRAIPVVFSSSSAVYGLPSVTPVTESHPQQPLNPYGVSKLIGERMLTDLDEAHGLRSVSLRYFNVAGVDPEGDIRTANVHLLHHVLTAALNDTRLRIFGNDYETPDGTCVRDFVHVCDVADAHLRALDFLMQGGTTCALNLASARGVSVMQVVSVAERVCGKPIQIDFAARRQGDPAVLIGDASRARELLGWEPGRLDLEGMIRDNWNWKLSRA